MCVEECCRRNFHYTVHCIFEMEVSFEGDSSTYDSFRFGSMSVFFYLINLLLFSDFTVVYRIDFSDFSIFFSSTK